MSNNIYDIMKKLNDVEGIDKVPETQSKNTTLLEATMQEVLGEKYMGFKAVAASAKKGGAKDPEAVAASIGRKKYGKEKFQAAAAKGKKLSERTWTNPETGEIHGSLASRLEPNPPQSPAPSLQQHMADHAARSRQSTQQPAAQSNQYQVNPDAIRQMIDQSRLQQQMADHAARSRQSMQRPAAQPYYSDTVPRNSGGNTPYIKHPSGGFPGLNPQSQYYPKTDTNVMNNALGQNMTKGSQKTVKEYDMEEGNLFTGAKERATGKKLGKNAKLSERVPVGSNTDLDAADFPMPGNKLSPKDQYSAIMKDVDHVQQGKRGLAPSVQLQRDSDKGRFAAPGLGDQGQFFQEDDMEEGNLFTGNLAKARAAGKKRADLDGDGDMETVKEQGVAEGYELKITKVRKYVMRGDPDNHIDDTKEKEVDYEIINLRTGEVVGTANIDTGDYFAGTKMTVTMKNGAKRMVDVRPGEGATSAFNRFVQNPKTSKKYQVEQGVAEGADSLRGTNEPKKKDAWGEGYWVGHRREDRDCPYPPGSFDAEMWELGYHEGNKDRKNEMTGRVMEEKKTTKTGTVHKAKPGRYGGYDPETDPDKDEDDKKSEPAVKRGRGRPKKSADSETGEVKKWDTSALQSAFGSSAPKKLPGKASVKHKMKDDDKLDEVAPPGKKAERMVKNIKKGYAKDGKLTDKEKGNAYATTWKAHNKGKVEESIPPGFPKSLAKKIYEQCDGDMKNTLSTMWKVYNSVMESKKSSKKKISEGMKFEQSTTKPAMGTYKGGLWTADPPKKGEVGAPVPSPDEGAPLKQQSKRRPQKEDVSENKELNDVLKLAGMVDESVKVDECGMSPISGAYGDTMHDTEGRMSINTNMSTDGNKTVTITADGDSAVELMQMLKMAGLSANSGEDTDIEKMSEEKDDRYEANTTPEEEILPVQTQLKGGDGEVAGKEKKMTPHGYKFADNPMAMSESMTLKLMKEYESIKKTK